MNVASRPASEKNYSRGREGHRIQALVIHIMEGGMNGTLAWFRNPVSKVSAHYGVSRKGEVVQYVPDEDTAQHAGVVDHPTAELVHENAGVNPNLWTIGIEHEGMSAQEPSPVQMVTSAELVAHLCEKHGIPLDEKHVIPHRAIRSSKSCPGKIDVRQIIALARTASAPVAPEPSVRPQPGDARWSEYFGERLVLTEYTDDRTYKFLRASQLRGLGSPGSAPWSALRQV